MVNYGIEDESSCENKGGISFSFFDFVPSNF